MGVRLHNEDRSVKAHHRWVGFHGGCFPTVFQSQSAFARVRMPPYGPHGGGGYGCAKLR